MEPCHTSNICTWQVCLTGQTWQSSKKNPIKLGIFKKLVLPVYSLFSPATVIHCLSVDFLLLDKKKNLNDWAFTTESSEMDNRKQRTKLSQQPVTVKFVAPSTVQQMIDLLALPKLLKTKMRTMIYQNWLTNQRGQNTDIFDLRNVSKEARSEFVYRKCGIATRMICKIDFGKTKRLKNRIFSTTWNFVKRATSAHGKFAWQDKQEERDPKKNPIKLGIFKWIILPVYPFFSAATVIHSLFVDFLQLNEKTMEDWKIEHFQRKAAKWITGNKEGSYLNSSRWL